MPSRKRGAYMVSKSVTKKPMVRIVNPKEEETRETILAAMAKTARDLSL